jgi:crotonobetainyl-CoA:carnitine CoA-transferase CaiB-like acyl-CoA transferase
MIGLERTQFAEELREDRGHGALTSGPLSGIRVIEMGAFIAGPYCGQLLGDLGADIVKIEQPSGGDAMRQWGAHPDNGVSLWWPVIGRNKRSMTINLREPKGQALARRLVDGADVLIENFRPGTLEGWGLSPDQLRETNPKLIVARVSGYGQTGPLRDRPGFAAVAEAAAGLRYLTGFPDRAPTRVGISIGDSLAGIFAALGVISSLYARDASGAGRGQDVDAAITESVLAVMESVISECSATGRSRERAGVILPGIAPSNIYPTADKSWVIIAANADALFARLARIMGQPELASDPRYSTHGARGRNQLELDELIVRWTRQRERDSLIEVLAEAGVPAGPVNDAASVLANQHFRQREAIVDIDNREFGRIAMQGIVPKLSQTPGAIRWAGPGLGEHTDAVCGELGLSAEEILTLRHDRII